VRYDRSDREVDICVNCVSLVGKAVVPRSGDAGGIVVGG
jgi:hypothetical protein